jgi:hypothetical protein
LLAGAEPTAVEFEEKNADHEARTPVAIDERMIRNEGGRAGSSQLYDVDLGTTGMVLPGSRQSRLEQRLITWAGLSTMQYEQLLVQCQRVALVNLPECPHLASA